MPRSSILLVIALGAWSPVLGQERETLATSPQEVPVTQRLAEHARAQPAHEGLSSSDWSSIRAAWDAGRHAAFPADGGWRARNPGQDWLASFDGRGVRVRPDASGWEWGLELVRWGFAGAERFVDAPLAVSAEGQRVAYRWDELLEEWYVNDARGLEHGFTVRERPAREGRAQAGPLTFTLAVRGELRPALAADGRGVRFSMESGAAALSYTGLVVRDADGQELRARLALAPEGLSIAVDERAARYPLTVDPLAQQILLQPALVEEADIFGWSVGVSGDTVVVGMPLEDSAATGVNGDPSNNSAPESGAAYVFVRDGTGWSQEAYLKASNAQTTDQFGLRVALDGDTLVVGVQREDSAAVGVNGNQGDNSAMDAGAAYVFVRDGAGWSQQAYLKASNSGLFDQFGAAIAVSGDLVVVGTTNEDSNAVGVNGNGSNNAATRAGAAYVFGRHGTTWSQEAYLKASNTEAQDAFGGSVSVSGNTVVVGATDEDSAASGVNGNQGNGLGSSGAAYVFVPSGTTWIQEAYLKASNPEIADFFGRHVAVSGDTLAVGATGEDSAASGVDGDQSDNSALNSGAVYVFVRDGTHQWSQEAYVKASNTGATDGFGTELGVSGDALVVAALGEDSGASGVNGDPGDESATNAGAAYLFRRAGTWSQRAYLKSLAPIAFASFGHSVAISGDTVVVGVPAESVSVPGSGAAYVFELGFEALVAFRNAGSNPASYAAGPIVLGSPFTATVDNTSVTQVASLVFGFDTPTSLLLAGGQTLLCLDLGSGELFTGANLAPIASAGGIDSYELAVPCDPTLAGLAFSSQAIQFGHPPFVLSNAQDFTVGGF